LEKVQTIAQHPVLLSSTDQPHSLSQLCASDEAVTSAQVGIKLEAKLPHLFSLY